MKDDTAGREGPAIRLDCEGGSPKGSTLFPEDVREHRAPIAPGERRE